ncbi:substrate-binding domain-containing protein [Diaminobutyricimonas sp. TR449]|uniref:substrate-binding domain-containing protein n=1 Tax=Diaminobutyricimonas sp. TR449 TaxID=2708076 RepID=UPI0014238E5E|nr:substrate-binding domain-containing protein [Diaminobutyricimonas sp. TR449]
MKNKKFIGAAATFGVVASLFLASPAAHAEAVCDGFAVVGSDTIQDVMTGIANGTNATGLPVRASGNGKVACNYDAIDPVYLKYGQTSHIQTKAFGPSFKRPNGSGNGQIALGRSIDGGFIDAAGTTKIIGQVDIARSSSDPGNSVDPTSGTLTNVMAAYPFARDAVSFATNAPGLTELSQAELTSIFTCQNLGANSRPQITVGGSLVEVTPVLPQKGSGTREFILPKVSNNAYNKDTTDAQLPSCIVIGQEHQTNFLANGNPLPANSVVVHSVAQWVAQANGVGTDRRGSGFTLGSAIPGTPAVTTNAGKLVPNASFYANTTFGRDTFLVTQASRTYPGSATFDTSLAALLGVSKTDFDVANIPGTSLLNQSTDPDTVGGVKLAYGFFPATNGDALDAHYAPLKSGNLG